MGALRDDPCDLSLALVVRDPIAQQPEAAVLEGTGKPAKEGLNKFILDFSDAASPAHVRTRCSRPAVQEHGVTV
jgi:hypothetical protein